ncbi:hypothetical protein CC80DRAFT_497734 [Byssothecium circinans]|uniref:Rhodopsin domain-containing protein n=1 Tax=Byssothecium circinans TaxID=147558 RepID=A0A6A5TA50_9PLEO|nr:hypothetical protein CC80DRAFT_497734 [Byssothecium circinans]
MAGLQVNIYVSVGVTWFAALATLIGRVLARRMARVDWWFDDYFSVLAFLFATGYCAIMIEWTLHWYLGKLMPDSLDDAARERVLYYCGMLGFFNSLCYASSLACSKLSILAFYWRLFKVSVIRIPILLMVGISAVWWIIRTFMLTFRCVPTRAIWDKSIKDAVCNIDSDKFFMGTITTHFLLDVAILVLPIVPVFKLRLRLQQKLGIVGFFLLGTIVCVASCIVLVILVHWPATTTQLPYDYATFCIWGAVEVNIAVVSGCCPLLRPIIGRVFPTLFPSGTQRSSQRRPSNAIKLTNLTSKAEKTRNADESSSMHELADPENRLDVDYLQDDRESGAGVHTIISSENKDRMHMRESELGLSRIHVRQETVVQVRGV